jgi:osmoprotectant transport system ATP-binding protein
VGSTAPSLSLLVGALVWGYGRSSPDAPVLTTRCKYPNPLGSIRVGTSGTLGPAAISLRHVSKTYPGTASPAVGDLSLDVPEGRIVAFVGPSGCGKTTTLKMINRLIEPTSGSIEVLGEDQRSVPAHELRRRIGYVIQQIGLFPHRTIRRNIGVVPELIGWDDARIAARTDELVNLVGLDPAVLDRYPAELSGGQQQRVGVARALAADPPILLMDEPYSAVDPIVREHLQDELLALQAKVRKTIVFVTHDIDEAIRLADRVAIFEVGGVLAQYDTPNGLLAAPASQFVASFLGRERGLRRLALLTVADVDFAPVTTVRASTAVGDAVAAAAGDPRDWIAVVDDADRFLGWIAATSLAARPSGSRVGDIPLEVPGATVQPATQLREALDLVVTSHARVATVVDGERFVGVVTIDSIAGGLDR